MCVPCTKLPSYCIADRHQVANVLFREQRLLSKNIYSPDLQLSGKYTLSVQCFLICCQIIYCENQQNFCQRIFALFILAYSFLLIMLSHFFEDFYLRPIWHDLKLWKQIWHVFSCTWLKTKPSINPTTTSLVPNDHLLFRYISFHPSPWMYTLEIM